MIWERVILDGIAVCLVFNVTVALLWMLVPNAFSKMLPPEIREAAPKRNKKEVVVLAGVLYPLSHLCVYEKAGSIGTDAAVLRDGQCDDYALERRPLPAAYHRITRGLLRLLYYRGQRVKGQEGVFEVMEKKGKRLWCLLAAGIAAAWYLWDLWYYGGLYREGLLFSAADASPETIGPLVCQHLLSDAPVLLVAVTFALVWRKDFFEISALTLYTKRGRISAALAGTVYLLLLPAGFLWGKGDWFAIGYQWGYYLLSVALMEELVYRGWLPYLIQKSGLPEWCVWVIPGVLFGCAHTLIPVIKEGFGLSILLTLLSSVTGYLAGACAFYGLRRWSGSLWLPVLLHAALDFTGVFGS